MLIMNGLLWTEADLRGRATRIRDLTRGSAFVRLRLIARDLCVDTRYERSPGLAEPVPDRQSVGRARDSIQWYVGRTLPKIIVELFFVAKSVWFRVLVVSRACGSHGH